MEKRQPDGTFTEEQITRKEIDRRLAPMRELPVSTTINTASHPGPNRATRRQIMRGQRAIARYR